MLKTPLNIKPSFWEHCSPLRPQAMVKSQRAAPIKSRSGFDGRSSSEHLRTDACVQSQHSCSKPPQSGGTSERMDQLTDNLAAIHLKLTQDELKSLDEASQLPPEYPEWMLATQGADRLGAVDLSSKSVNKNKQQFNSVDERLRQDVRH